MFPLLLNNLYLRKNYSRFNSLKMKKGRFIDSKAPEYLTISCTLDSAFWFLQLSFLMARFICYVDLSTLFLGIFNHEKQSRHTNWIDSTRLELTGRSKQFSVRFFIFLSYTLRNIKQVDIFAIIRLLCWPQQLGLIWIWNASMILIILSLSKQTWRHGKYYWF